MPIKLWQRGYRKMTQLSILKHDILPHIWKHISENIWLNSWICHILITVYCAEKYVITITTYNIYLHTLYCQNMLPFCANFYYTLNLSHKFSAKYQTLWWVPLRHYPAVKSYFPRRKLTFTAPSGVRFNFFVTLNEIIIFIQIKDCNERALSRLLPFDSAIYLMIYN